MSSTLRIEKKSITDMPVDCIVNAANSRLQRGGGVCGTIFAAAGPDELQKACNAIGGCHTGEAVITPGFRLKAPYIVHGVGPIWQGGNQNEERMLYACYQNAMKIAYAKGCRSIAFPLISSGSYGYPVREAWRVAIAAILESPYQMDVTIAVIDDRSLQMGMSILKDRVTRKSNADKEFQFFWHEYDMYGEFSQWFYSPFVVEGIRYETAEQYMMSRKALLCEDLIRYALILNEPDPARCKKLGREVRNFEKYQSQWEACREEVIYHGNLAKFRQNETAKEVLLSTGDKILAEASPIDAVWGIGMDARDPRCRDPQKWNGENLLGKALMRVRDMLRKEG